MKAMIDDDCGEYLSTRTANALIHEGILTTAQLLELSTAEIGRISGIGPGGRMEIAGMRAVVATQVQRKPKIKQERGNCRFAVYTTSPNATDGIQCRHRSPTFEPHLNAWRAGWPFVFETEWCGDYESRP